MTFLRRRPFRALAVALATTPLLLAAACSHASDTPTGSTASGSTKALPKTLVFSPLSLAPPALKGLSEGVKGLASSQGWEVIVQDPNFDATKQVQQLNEVISSGRAGAAWILAVAPKSLGDLIKTAQAKGVPLLVNGKPDEYGFSGPQPGITFDYIDYTAGGKALGEQLGKCITEKNGGTGKVLYVASQEGTAGKQEFDTAAAEAFKAAAPNATLAQTIVSVDRAKAQTDIGNALQGNPDLVGVFSANDEGALGALGAFNAAGKKLTCVTDFGGNDEVLKNVTSGKIYASVALQFNDDTAQSFNTLVKMQADPKANGEVLIVPQKTFTQGS
ncbi:ABC-type sugar transport system substrate-binding protein [Actinoplanes tereljensis]|uniref:D-ribose ABC transporter substrate-binding protein n=1 Tax=Paractinoplanes tereljensis TaxID=571912 RepID=A0A919NVA1_9ACTN|nr:sugar ABC transporter substrate-binding protein [Actinoplanes tereljensis]GIF25373.1 D-ribose ABC transporter substrate-binding protein [Actinoplanes tereljensis]